jgi:phospholipid/cholesterol/gamma-HCH transport system substrate-binding protein
MARATHLMIGTVTLAAIAVGFMGFLGFRKIHAVQQRGPLRLVFEGSAAGLVKGGSVNFDGVQVGEVMSIKLDGPRKIVALVTLENSAPIRKDTIVGLEAQGLTGVMAIALVGGSDAAPPVPLDEDGIPVLTADPNKLQDVTEAIRATLQNINKVVADNQEAVKNSLKNLEVFTTSLSRNSERIDAIMSRVDGVMGKADSLMLGLNTLAGGKDGGELLLTVKSIRELAEDFDKRSGALMSDGRRTLADISRAVNNFDRNPTRVLFGASNSSSSAQASQPAPPPAAAAAASGRRQ